MNRQAQGFTLIELMVTVAVLAIIVVMAAPSFGEMLSNQNLNRSTQELIATLKDARARAVLERKEVTVELNKNPKDSTSTVLKWQPAGDAILKSTTVSIVFNLSGGVKNATTDTGFTVCNKSGGTKSKTFSVSPMGMIQQVTEGTCS